MKSPNSVIDEFEEFFKDEGTSPLRVPLFGTGDLLEKVSTKMAAPARVFLFDAEAKHIGGQFMGKPFVVTLKDELVVVSCGPDIRYPLVEAVSKLGGLKNGMLTRGIDVVIDDVDTLDILLTKVS